ncbi:hypothetical protein KCM76_10810 [Zooshikella marina]|uniref:hypothetical protein n=1 Tax=Zooshikella ganghwensis TaxID=202772 RepID=UPI001BAEC230|nr:hypothetical protein [Zooshikella ganghwensis]MBU2706477.1 hypothetical protein [Zooshikella ganghwensis]
MELAKITKKIIECLEDEVDVVENIGSQTGLLDIRNPQIIAENFPAIRITPKQLSPKQLDYFNTQEYEATYLLYYFNKAKDDWMDDVASLNLLDKVLRLVKSNNWGINSITPAMNITANALTVRQINGHLINGWQVEWQHTMQLECENNTVETPVKPKSLYFSSNRDDFGIADKYSEVKGYER